MIIVACALAVAIVAVAWLLTRHNRELIAQHALEQQAWAAERRELLNRIQRPELVPAAPVTHYPAPDPEPDDIEKVGTIHFDPDQPAVDYPYDDLPG